MHNLIHSTAIAILLTILMSLAASAAEDQGLKPDFTADPLNGQVPLTVRFTDRSRGQIDQRLWDFDFDGQPDSSENNPVFTFTQPGQYTVSLIVIGADGARTETKTRFIRVLDEAEAGPTNGSISDSPASIDGRSEDWRAAESSPQDGKAVLFNSAGADLQPGGMVTTAPTVNADKGGAGLSRAAASDPNKDKEKIEKTRKIKLRWDASLEATVAGYKIYYKPDSSGPPYNGRGADQGDSPVTIFKEDLKNQDNPRFELTGLNKDRDYFFALKAFDDQVPPNESRFSNEASTLDVDTGGGSGGGGGGCFIDAVRSCSEKQM